MPHPVALARISSQLGGFEGAFLCCTDCQSVHRVTRGDTAPVYLQDGAATDADDFQKFLSAHADHRFQLLRRSSDVEMISHPRWDPMCRIAWEVSDGEHEYVVTFGRTDLARAREYGISPGHVVLESESVAVDSDVFRRLVDEAMFPHAASQRKIEALLDKCRRLVASVPGDRFEPVDEVRDDPSVQLACMPGAVAEELRAEALSLFSADEATRLVEVIDNDLRRYIPVVRVARRYRIESAALTPPHGRGAVTSGELT